MKQLNNNGFTLIELLGVIVILSILIIIVIPKITSSVKNKTGEIDEVTFNIITKATELYLYDNSSSYEEIEGKIYCIPLTNLTENGYLEVPIKSFKDSTDLTNIKTVKVEYDDGYTYIIVDNNKCIESNS